MPQSPSPIKLGRFRVDARIAVGGMATVYRARLSGAGGFERRFALKLIHPHLAREPGFLDRFYDEARVASRIRHPNVVSTVGIEEVDGRNFLVLELIDGVTLRQLELHREARLPGSEAARIIADVARGLHAVHTVADESGTPLEAIHRDISPHNIMIDTEGRAVLIDLGLVKARGQLGHTQTGVLAGKLPYMSPEQSMLARLDARSDVFSLGSVLFELVVGELPFGDDHQPDTLDRLRACDRSELATRLEQANVAPWVSSIVLACLHADPSCRFQSAMQLAEAIEDELQNAGVTDAETRRWISTNAKITREALPFATQLEASELGIAPRRAGRGALVWGGLAIAAAAVAAFYGASVWEQTQAEPAREAPAMAIDAAMREAPPQPATSVQGASSTAAGAARSEPASVPEVELVELDASEAQGDEARPRSARRRRASAPKAEPTAELKDNPYTN